MAKTERKTLPLSVIDREIGKIEVHYHFDPDNGTAQLAGSSEERIAAYGAWRVLMDLLEELQ